MRLFQEKLYAVAMDEGADVVGYSLSSVQRYWDGELIPTLGFLEAAARVLDVRYAWLATGHGERTEELEAARLEEEAVFEEAPQEVRAAFADALGHPLDVLSVSSRAAILRAYDAARTLPSFAPTPSISDPDFVGFKARLVVDSIYAPLRELHVDPAAAFPAPDEALDAYIVGASLTLSHLFHALRRSLEYEIDDTPDPEDADT